MPLDLALFVAAAAVVWLAGTRITRYAKVIAERTKLGQAVIGLLLLGGITSLPELGTSVTAAVRSNAALAVNNILGGVALQVVLLAVADVRFGRGALSTAITSPSVLLLAILDIALLTLAAAGIGLGEVEVLGFGLWTASLALACLVSVWLVSSFRDRRTWIAAGPAPGTRTPAGQAARGGTERLSNRALAVRTIIGGLIILGAGTVLATRGEALAEQTGLGDSFTGALLVALATSLPEMSTAVEAVRLRQHAMAFADIFGTNLIDLALLFVIDVFYQGPPVLNLVGPFSLCAALLGLLLTTIYLGGLIERRDRAILRMGIDSLLVLIVYAGGLVLLYQLRP